jgi:hypothetical protein
LGWEHATPEEGTQRLLISTSKREEGREGCAKIKGSRGRREKREGEKEEACSAKTLRMEMKKKKRRRGREGEKKDNDGAKRSSAEEGKEREGRKRPRLPVEKKKRKDEKGEGDGRWAMG